MGQQWTPAGAGTLGAADLAVAYALLEEVAINPTIELPDLTQDRGNRLLEGTNKTLCMPGSRRKEQWPQEADPDLPVSVQESLAEAWVGRGLLQGRGHTACLGPLEGGRHYLHHLHGSLASGQTTGREHSPAHQQKIGFKIYWAWAHQNKIQFPPQSVSPIRKLPKPFILIHQRADRLKTTITEN